MKSIAALLLAGLVACGGGGEPGEIVRTPDEQFADLPGFPFEPHYLEIRGLRIHYLDEGPADEGPADEGPADARPVLLLHGEPSWSFLYRTMIPVLTAAGYRVVAPDMVGFGRSDKYVRLDDYSFQLHVDLMAELVRRLDLRDAVFFGQDWGGLVGLRVVADDPDRFAAVVVGNTGLPAPEPGDSAPLPFRFWQLFARWSPVFPAGRIVQAATTSDLPPAVRAAYDAPFPTRRHQAGARIFPSLVPLTADDPAVPAMRAAWEVLERWEKPFVTAFSDGDPITRGLDASFRERVPGARGQPHVTIEGAGHFLQEDRGPELAEVIVGVARRLDLEGAVADRIYLGEIITVDAADRVAEAVAVKDGRILAVGTRAEVMERRGDGTRVVSLAGRALLPGFIDSHSHLMLVAQKLEAADVSPQAPAAATSFADLRRMLLAHEGRSDLASGDWLIGWGYDHSKLAEGRHPTRDDLDAISTERPIALLHFSGHQAVLNSKALEIAGYSADTPDPPGGAIGRRPGSLEPDGMVQEQAWLPVFVKLLQAPFDERVERVARALELYASHGFTTVQEGALQDPDALQIFRALAESGRLEQDVIAFPYHAFLGQYEGDFEALRAVGERFRFGGVKLVLDGGSPGRTAWLREPYHVQLEGEDEFRGFPHHAEQGEVDALLIELYGRGLPVNIHALGDAAVDQAIDAIRAAERAVPGRDRRTNLIHLQVLGEDQLDALATLDVTLTFQVAHNYYFGELHREHTLGPERAARLNPARSALERGFHFTIHHDAPVHPVDQMLLIWAAVNRVTDAGAVLGPAQRIPVEAALRASTWDAAYQYFEEDRKGSIEPGKLADFVILSESPLRADPMRLREIRVLETIKEGETIYRAPPGQRGG